MVVITITKWKRKFVALVMALVLLVSLGLGVSWYLQPDDNPAVAPSDNLEDDVLTQPVKVQGQPAGQDGANGQEQEPTPEGK